MQTYLGFCVRARKIAYGTDEIETQKKGVYLIVCDNTLSDNSLKNIHKARERLGCPLIMGDSGALADALHKPAVKAVAIKDKNLALAILSVVESELQFNLYSGGNE